MHYSVNKPYDSHIHFLLTGEYELSFQFQEQDDFNFLKELSFEKAFLRDHFFIGRQLNKKKFEQFLLKEKLSALDFLNSVDNNRPLYLVTEDGHTGYINSAALDYFNNTKFLQPMSINVEQGCAFEEAHFQLYQNLPEFNHGQNIELIEKAVSKFHQSGFTHLRDMTMDSQTWELLLQNPQKIFIEAYIYLKSFEQLDETLARIQQMKKNSSDRQLMRGLKIFFDGALHSQSVAMSAISDKSLTCDCKEANVASNILWTEERFKNVLRKCWAQKVELAVHAIGDYAADKVVDWSRQVMSEGFVGRLCLEHAEFLRPETINKMKSLHIEVHMQPSHLIKDSHWITENPAYGKWTMQWEKLNAIDVPVYFGSDSPFVEPSWQKTKQGLMIPDSRMWSRPLKKQFDWNKAVIAHHQCKNEKSPSSELILNKDLNIEELYFENDRLI